jgi:PAS domain S-box-containing protein
MRDVDMPEYERSHLSGFARISDEVLLSGLLSASELNIFWKDERRQFVGANKSFLDYFGFKSMEEIFGKTDEDLGWGIRNKSFRDDELRVLLGEQMTAAEGVTIHDGELRNMSISRIPLFREGRVIGMVGYFKDTGRHDTYAEVVEQIRREALRRGYRRSVLLGSPEVMAGGMLRKSLAASGVMVLAPGKDDREWIGRHLTRGFDSEAITHLGSLLRDAMSHGADSLVVAHPVVLEATERLAVGLPVLDATRVSWFS